MIVVQTAAGLLMVAGVAYLLLALWRVAEWAEAATGRAARPQPVTVLVPCHGAAPRLADCLRSVMAQDYPGMQVVFGLHRGDDPARPVIEAVMAEFPGREAELVIDAARIGANPKNCNLANMMRVARHDLLVMVDSDVMVEPGFVAAVVAPLGDPAMGGVTCPYKGLPMPGLAARLGALGINDWFIPSVLVDAGRRELDLAYGAAIAVRRDSLAAVGGFEAMASAVAQDYVLGHRLHAHGYRVALARHVVATVVAEATLSQLLRHELRWNRTVRAVRPRDHAASVVTSPLLPFLLLAGPSWPWPATLAAVALEQGLRALLHLLLRRRLRLPPPEPWLLPLREAANALVWAASFFGRRIRWGAAVMVTGGGLSMRIDGPGADGGGKP